MIKKLQFTCRKFQDCNFDFTSIHKHHAQFYPKILAGQHTLFLYKQSPSINQIYLQSTIQGQSQNFIPVLCYFYMRPIKICTEVCGGVQTNIYIYIYAQKTLRELHLAAARKATGLPLFASLDSYYQETGGKHFMIEVSRRLHFCFIKVHYSVLYRVHDIHYMDLRDLISQRALAGGLAMVLLASLFLYSLCPNLFKKRRQKDRFQMTIFLFRYNIII